MGSGQWKPEIKEDEMSTETRKKRRAESGISKDVENGRIRKKFQDCMTFWGGRNTRKWES